MEWANLRKTWDSGGTIGAASTDYRQLCQYLASGQTQRGWWFRQAAEKIIETCTLAAHMNAR